MRVNSIDVPTLHAEVMAIRQLPDKERRQAENDFIAKYAPAFLAARLHWWRGDDIAAEDQEQAATEALLKALRTWQPGMGRGFRGWAAWAIRFALQGELRRSRLVRGRKDGYASIDERPGDDTKMAYCGGEAALQVQARSEGDADREARLAALDSMTPTERRCLAMVFNVPGVDADVDVSGMAAAEREAIARKALKRLRAAVD